MIAAPPLMHRKGHAGSGDQQCHQDNHGFGRCRFTYAPSTSRGHADERAFHLLLDALNGAGADAALARDLAHAFTRRLPTYRAFPTAAARIWNSAYLLPISRAF